MAINKIIDRQGNTLLDLSADSVTSENFVLAGKTYHGPDGIQHTGTLDPGPLEYSQYNFIDYDGTLLYSYTDEELDALEALPAGPDHTADNLTFQEWNWTLANLKAWDRTRADRPIVGANLITTDGKSYIYLDTPYTGATLKFYKSGTLNSVDWGDGTTDTNTSHVYSNPGQYIIVIDMAENGYWYIGSDSPSSSANKQWIKKIKLGNIKRIPYNGFNGCYNLESISIPNSITNIEEQAFVNCFDLQSISIPNNITSITNYMLGNCYSLQSISIPNSITDIKSSVFSNCNRLQKVSIPNSITLIDDQTFNYCYDLPNISIPNSVTSIGTNAFQYCRSISMISIPNSVTSIKTNAFIYCHSLTLDLTKQTKVITLSSEIGLDIMYNQILVPNSLLQDYKTANYWNHYASIMVGV